MQRVKPPPGFERLGGRVKGGISSSPVKLSSKTLDADADDYGEAMHSLFGPFDSDDDVSPYILNRQYQTPDSHSTT